MVGVAMTAVRVEGIVHARHGQGFQGGYTICGRKYAHGARLVRMLWVPAGFQVEDEEVDCMACIAAGCAT